MDFFLGKETDKSPEVQELNDKRISYLKNLINNLQIQKISMQFWFHKEL